MFDILIHTTRIWCLVNKNWGPLRRNAQHCVETHSIAAKQLNRIQGETVAYYGMARPDQSLTVVNGYCFTSIQHTIFLRILIYFRNTSFTRLGMLMQSDIELEVQQGPGYCELCSGQVSLGAIKDSTNCELIRMSSPVWIRTVLDQDHRVEIYKCQSMKISMHRSI